MSVAVPAFWVNHRSLVGAGLLAKAVCQTTLMLNVMASSRASRIAAPPLPQGMCGVSASGVRC
ncbi:hypothetical protein E3W21_07050 [Pseudomonas sp. F01002]|nr:hypothetical protein E3W21_07050 [Pseudomonas sp. F01002]